MVGFVQRDQIIYLKMRRSVKTQHRIFMCKCCFCLCFEFKIEQRTLFDSTFAFFWVDLSLHGELKLGCNRVVVA